MWNTLWKWDGIDLFIVCTYLITCGQKRCSFENKVSHEKFLILMLKGSKTRNRTQGKNCTNFFRRKEHYIYGKAGYQQRGYKWAFFANTSASLYFNLYDILT